MGMMPSPWASRSTGTAWPNKPVKRGSGAQPSPFVLHGMQMMVPEEKSVGTRVGLSMSSLPRVVAVDCYGQDAFALGHQAYRDNLAQ